MQSLSAEAFALLTGAVEAEGSQAKAAKRIGISSASVSLLLKGLYRSDASVMERKIRGALDHVTCPHLGQVIAGPECIGHRTSRVPTHNPRTLRHWQECQHCPIGARLTGGKP
jgi:DNA-binding transcriptional regulator YdaS (Cro superfamily)